MKQLILSLVLGVAAIGMVVPQQATAVPTLRVTDGITTIDLPNGAAADLNPAPGAVTSYYIIGNWSLNVTTGLVLNAERPFMDLNSLNVSSISSGQTSLDIYFSQTDFMTDNGYWEAAIGGTASNTIQYATYLDGTNTLFGTGTELTDSGPLAPNPLGTFLDERTSDSIASDPYSLTQYVKIVHDAGLQSSAFNAELRSVPESSNLPQSVPEPSALLLMGLGFLGLALWQRREARS